MSLTGFWAKTANFDSPTKWTCGRKGWLNWPLAGENDLQLWIHFSETCYVRIKMHVFFFPFNRENLFTFWTRAFTCHRKDLCGKNAQTALWTSLVSCFDLILKESSAEDLKEGDFFRRSLVCAQGELFFSCRSDKLLVKKTNRNLILKETYLIWPFE